MKKSLILVAAALAVLAGCSKESVQYAPAGLVKVEPVITRATDVDFETGDAIGLTIVKGTANYASNVKMTYASNVFTGTTSWYTAATETSTLVAYYPYQASGMPTSFTVASDQSNGVTSSDYMAAVKSDVLPSANAVSMVFKHQLTKIVVKVANKSLNAVSKVFIGNSVPKATVAPATQSVTVDATASAAQITCAKTTDSTYQAIVVPQTVAFNVGVVLSSGDTLSQKLVSLDLKQGGQYSVQVVVAASATKIYVSASGDIENWSDEGTIAADNTPSFQEFSDHFVYDGVSYRTVTLKDGRTWMADPMRYVPAGKTLGSDPAVASGIWYPYSSAGVALTDEASIAKFGYLYDYQTAFGATIDTLNFKTFEGAQGICPKGWHIPTRAEMVAVCGYSVAAVGESGVMTNTSAAYYDATYNGAKVDTVDKAGFNFAFSGTINRSTVAGTGSYLKVVLSASNCSIAEWYGNLGMTYLMSSTGNKFTTNSGALSNIQFFGMMTTFTSAYKEGRLTVAMTNFLSGYQLRCIKNQ
jgi:uncharacterized protein (TIGR02145 family)